MQQSRSERRAKVRHARRRRVVLSAVMFALIALPAATAILARTHAPAGGASAPALKGASRALATTQVVSSDTPHVATRDDSSTAPTYLAFSREAASVETTLVEVPDVVGRRVSDAAAVLKAAGLVADTAGTPSGSSEVTAQQPRTGEIVQPGTRVLLSVATATAKRVQATSVRQPIVCIDPGHQSRSNSAKEPIGPGATQTKAKVTGGATGIATHVPEYEIALQIAMNVKARLARSGVKVVITRTTNDVNISNAQRAQIANRVSANLFLRIHANGSPNSRQTGVSVLYPAAAGFTKTTSAPSRRAALLVQRSVLSATGAPSDGLYSRSDLAGFNWCTRPAILIECGYLSNPVEDRLLTGPAYQDKVAVGIARGVLAYLGR